MHRRSRANAPTTPTPLHRQLDMDHLLQAAWYGAMLGGRLTVTIPHVTLSLSLPSHDVLTLPTSTLVLFINPPPPPPPSLQETHLVYKFTSLLVAILITHSILNLFPHRPRPSAPPPPCLPSNASQNSASGITHLKRNLKRRLTHLLV
jgi:hypothetical protein